MKSADEIKKSLAACNAGECYGTHTHADCSYYKGSVLCHQGLCGDALAYIQQLEVDNSQLRNYIRLLQTERDAAVRDIYEMAKSIPEDVCEWCDQTECERLCMMHATERPGFKWRGVQKEDSNA